MSGIVIVGASAAGLTVAETLRARGFGGPLTLIGDEPHHPYDRPPLSKQLLAGTLGVADLALRPSTDYPALGAELRLSTRATRLDIASHTVRLDDGSHVCYDKLVIATGVRPRRLASGDPPAGVHVLRTLADALALRSALSAVRRPVVVVGAGFLGTEVAATIRGLGLRVTLVDPLPQPMYRQLGATVGAAVAALHTAHGVRVRTGCSVAGLTEADGRVTGVSLAGGETLPADLVLLALGCLPATDWLAGSGLGLGDGVVCDAYLRAAPDVYAAGDVASWQDRGSGSRLRLEHRTNATEQGISVADNLLGAATPFSSVPYFWTDQFEARVQVYGVLPPDARVEVVWGEVGAGRFVALAERGGLVCWALGWNSARELRGYRALVAERAPWPDLTYR